MAAEVRLFSSSGFYAVALHGVLYTGTDEGTIMTAFCEESEVIVKTPPFQAPEIAVFIWKRLFAIYFNSLYFSL
jgi:hypothetical protein